GPWRPDWSLETLKTLRIPLLGLTATVEEEMGWGTNHKSLIPNLPPGAELVPFENTGHFIHIEHPERVATLVLRFLG
ncbi:MAG TPA: alpha/beta hydrolase, partial [Tepidiformaceae bacterium]|nr:alpha/beta hydrolase [Tepidiformaceae bacterium]